MLGVRNTVYLPIIEKLVQIQSLRLLSFPVNITMKKILSGTDWRSISLSALALLAALATALLVAAIITRIQHQADKGRQAQIVLMRLDKKVVELRNLEREMSGNPELIQSDMSQLEALNSEMQSCLDRLPVSARSTVSWLKVRKALAVYQQQVAQEMLLYLDDAPAAARRVHDEHINASADVLTGAIYAADKSNNDEAVLANETADAGTAGVLLGGALMLYIFVRRFVGAKRRGTKLATEQAMLLASEQRFRALIRNASDVIAIVTPDGKFGYLSSAVNRVWGYESEALENTSVFALLHSEDTLRMSAHLSLAQSNPNECHSLEIRLRPAEGEWRMFEIVLTNLLQEPGIEGIVLTCRDISERKAFEEHLAYQAFHDSLTCLPNRALFMERLVHALARSVRQGTTVAVLFLDMDNFKVVNDSLGHEAGDRLLISVGQRLSACVRPGDTVARLGGDEFTILLEDLPGEEQIHDLADRVCEAIHTPVLLSDREIVMSGSLGIASANAGNSTAAQLLREADTAMYQAKTSGKARSVVFSSQMNRQAMDRLEMEIDLRHALENGEELRVFYQPIIALDSSSLSEVEALVRWEHPERGLLPPGTFIPLAEETGLIIPLGRWVLGEACRQMRAWQQQYPNEPPLTVSVNVSAHQLHQTDMVQQVVCVLKESELLPQYLKLEITESVMMQDAENIIPRLHELRNLGVRLAMDDFGTGYSSMAYLSSLPIDTLKIDRSFISKMSRSDEDAAIVRAIVTLAKTLDLRITSEGIETSDQLAELSALGCDFGQGYFIDRPMPAENLGLLLAPKSLKDLSRPESSLLAAA